LLLAGGAEPALIEESYLRAIEVAQEQQARAIELRAVIELCQLRQKQGKLQEARQLMCARQYLTCKIRIHGGGMT
jgi:hypothetical protein